MANFDFTGKTITDLHEDLDELETIAEDPENTDSDVEAEIDAIKEEISKRQNQKTAVPKTDFANIVQTREGGNVLSVEDIAEYLHCNIDDHAMPAFLKGVSGRPIRLRILNHIDDERCFEELSIVYNQTEEYYQGRQEKVIREATYNFDVKLEKVNGVDVLMFYKLNSSSGKAFYVPLAGLKVQVKEIFLKKRAYLVFAFNQVPLYKDTNKGRYDK